MNHTRAIIGTGALGGGGAVLASTLGLATPEQIGVGAAIIAGGVTVLASVVAALKSLSTDKKVDNITVLVDGRYSEVLSEIATLTDVIANASGLPGDRLKADAAKLRADSQSARVADSEKKA
jgi:hypothetical protein